MPFYQNNKYDGMFYMSIYDFQYIFTYVEIVHYNSDYSMTYIDT